MNNLNLSKAINEKGTYIFKNNDEYILYNIICELKEPLRETILKELSKSSDIKKKVSIVVEDEYNHGFVFVNSEADQKLTFVYSKVRETMINFLLTRAEDYQMNNTLLCSVMKNLLNEHTINKFKQRKMNDTLSELNSKFHLNLKL